MANRDSNNPDLGQGGSDRSDRGQSESQSDREKSEWLRDQVGEDHNLSGSSTYRTLPDQPENTEDDSERDVKDRQSNR